jgi:acyl-coenzyme A thioesterase PaaI-like protein
MASDGRGYLRKSSGLPLELCRFADGAIGTFVTFEERHTSYPRVVHGGVVSALVDQVMGDAIAVERGIMGLSITLRVRMINPLVVGRNYRVSTHVKSVDDGVIEAHSEVTDEHHDVHVMATGTFRPIRADQARQLMGLSDVECDKLGTYLDYEAG